MKLFQIRYIIFFACIIFVFTNCRHSMTYPAGFTTADSLCISNPDSAVVFLSSMESGMENASEANLRYYQLLTIKARDKAYLPHSSDSLVLEILRYYENGGDPRLLPEALYYAGRITFDLGDALQSLDYYQRAFDAIDNETYEKYYQTNAIEANRLKACITAQKAHILSLLYFYDEAILEFQNSIKYDSICNDSSGLISNYRNLGHAYVQKKQYDKAINNYRISREMAFLHKDSARFTSAVYEEIYALLTIGDINSARTLFDQHPITLSRFNRDLILEILADFHYHNGEEEIAAKYFSDILQSSNLTARLNANRWMAHYAFSQNQTKKAEQYLSEAISLEDSIWTFRNNQDVSRAHSLYNYQLRERENHKLRESKAKVEGYMYLSGTIVFFFIIAAVFFLINGRRKLISVRNQYEQIQYLLKSKEAEDESEIAKREKGMNMLRNSEAMKLVLVKAEKQRVLTAEDWIEIESTLKECLPSFLPDIHSVHTYSQVERQMTILTKMELPPAVIAILLGRTKSAIYNMRYRLYNKVFGEDKKYKDWQDFIMSL